MKAVGGVLVGLVMASFLIILLWRGADALSARRPAFRHWYQLRRLRFRAGLTLVSLCFGAAAGFGSANFKPGPNKKDWLTPKDSPRVDKELARCLQAKFAGKETFLGVTRSRRLVRRAPASAKDTCRSWAPRGRESLNSSSALVASGASPIAVGATQGLSGEVTSRWTPSANRSRPASRSIPTPGFGSICRRGSSIDGGA